MSAVVCLLSEPEGDHVASGICRADYAHAAGEDHLQQHLPGLIPRTWCHVVLPVLVMLLSKQWFVSGAHVLRRNTAVREWSASASIMLAG